MQNGHKKNITIFDPKTICYLDDLKTSTGQTWDETFRMLIRQNRQDRDKHLELKLKELAEWVSFAYPDRLDMVAVMEKVRVMVSNQFLMAEPDRMLEMANRLGVMHRDLIVEFRKKGDD